MGDSSAGPPRKPATQAHSSSGSRASAVNQDAVRTATPAFATTTNQQLRDDVAARDVQIARMEQTIRTLQRVEGSIKEQIDQRLEADMPTLCQLQAQMGAESVGQKELTLQIEHLHDQARAALASQQQKSAIVRDWANGKGITLDANHQAVFALLLQDDASVQSMVNQKLAQYKHERQLEAQNKEKLSNLRDELESEQAREQREFTEQFWNVYHEYENKLDPALREEVLALKPKLLKQKYALDDPLITQMRDEDFGAGYFQAHRDNEYQALVNEGKAVPKEFAVHFKHLQSRMDKYHPYQIGLRFGETVGFRHFCHINDDDYQTSKLDRSLSDQKWTSWEQFRMLDEEEKPEPDTFYDGFKTGSLDVISEATAQLAEQGGFKQITRKGQSASASRASTAAPPLVPKQDPAPAHKRDYAQEAAQRRRRRECNYCHRRGHYASDCFAKVIDEAFGLEKLYKLDGQSQYPRLNHAQHLAMYHRQYKGNKNLINKITDAQQAAASSAAGPSTQQNSQVAKPQRTAAVAAEPEAAKPQEVLVEDDSTGVAETAAGEEVLINDNSTDVADNAAVEQEEPGSNETVEILKGGRGSAYPDDAQGQQLDQYENYDQYQGRGGPPMGPHPGQCQGTFDRRQMHGQPCQQQSDYYHSGPPQGDPAQVWNGQGWNGPPPQSGYAGPPPQGNWGGQSHGNWSGPPSGGYNGPPQQGGYSGPPQDNWSDPQGSYNSPY